MLMKPCERCGRNHAGICGRELPQKTVQAIINDYLNFAKKQK